MVLFTDQNSEAFNAFVSVISQKVAAEILKQNLSTTSSFKEVEEEILSPKEVSKLLKKSIPTINRLVKNKIIRKYQFPDSRRVYFLKSEIMEVLKSNHIHVCKK
jgi:predicted DNA-binding transcriptional regulator AlpA